MHEKAKDHPIYHIQCPASESSRSNCNLKTSTMCRSRNSLAATTKIFLISHDSDSVLRSSGGQSDEGGKLEEADHVWLEMAGGTGKG